jgi:PII-like signaling protein
VIADALKLSIYFGDAAMAGSELASHALMRHFAERGLRVAVLLRGVEGFGINRRIRAERFPDISTDLPLLAVAVDQRDRIEPMLDAVDAIVPQGLVTLEYARLATDKGRRRGAVSRGRRTSGQAHHLLRPGRAI